MVRGGSVWSLRDRRLDEGISESSRVGGSLQGAWLNGYAFAMRTAIAEQIQVHQFPLQLNVRSGPQGTGHFIHQEISEPGVGPLQHLAGRGGVDRLARSEVRCSAICAERASGFSMR